jgi:predicted DNA-binding antitoxin AbrB/MazE fold protein
MTVANAIYENGVFKPIQPVSLPEGARVELTIVPYPMARDGKSPAEILERIANLPGNEEEDQGDNFSGEDHDEVLYGRKASD